MFLKTIKINFLKISSIFESRQRPSFVDFRKFLPVTSLKSLKIKIFCVYNCLKNLARAVVCSLAWDVDRQLMSHRNLIVVVFTSRIPCASARRLEHFFTRFVVIYCVIDVWKKQTESRL